MKAYLVNRETNYKQQNVIILQLNHSKCVTLCRILARHHFQTTRNIELITLHDLPRFLLTWIILRYRDALEWSEDSRFQKLVSSTQMSLASYHDIKYSNPEGSQILYINDGSRQTSHNLNYRVFKEKHSASHAEFLPDCPSHKTDCSASSCHCHRLQSASPALLLFQETTQSVEWCENVAQKNTVIWNMHK